MSTVQTINPTTEEVLGTYTLMGKEEVDAKIEACHAAFESWKKRSVEERGQVLTGIADALEAKKEELSQLMTAEMGKPIAHSRQEVDLCAQICRHTAEIAPAELAPEERDIPSGKRGRIVRSPLGVIYGIQPWNFPTYQVVRYSIANLAAGNGVLLKHAECVTGSALMLSEIYTQGGLPKNLFQVLITDHDVSDHVIEHAKVRAVTLTGSDGAGRKVAAKAGEQLKKTVMELGSNDAFVVLEDADLDVTVPQCVMGRTYNNGEVCVAAKRFIVVDELYDAFKERFVAAMKDVSYGNPTDPNVKMGPMARKDLRETLHAQTQESIDKGAVALCGGQMPEGKGYFYPATVLENVQPGQPAYDDELFGPVASLIRAKDADDAMRIANDSRYGLGGGIFSKNVERAVELASESFDTGMVFINGFGLAQPNMPFGGVKDSGWGREHGGFGLTELVNTKSVLVMND